MHKATVTKQSDEISELRQAIAQSESAINRLVKEKSTAEATLTALKAD